MFTPKCDAMAGVVIGAMDAAMTAVASEITPSQNAKEQAQSVMGDLMGWGGQGISMHSVSNGELGSLAAPSMGAAPAKSGPGQMFGW